MTSGGRGTRAQSDAAYSMRPMAIKISTDVEVSHTPASFDNDKKVSHDSDSNITPYTNDPSNAV